MMVLLLFFSGLAGNRNRMNVESLKGFLGIRISTFTSEGDGCLDVPLRFLLDLCRIGFGEDPVLEQMGAQEHQGITSFPAHEFFLTAIIERVKKRPFSMMTEAVGFGLYQGGALSCPCALDRLADHFIDRDGVLTIDRDSRDIVGLGTLRNMVDGDDFLCWDGHGIA